MSDAAIPAATLILVRDRAGAAPELLTVERAEGMTFAGGALVFPGGRIDAQDEALAARFETADAAARIAAIRETIEETAIPVGIWPTPSAKALGEMQRQLADGAGFAELLDRSGVRLAPDALTPLARWVPRFHAKRRFDTLFFLARAPEGDWTPRPLPGECAGAFWISAAEVLEQDRTGSAKLIFPTRRTLERLAKSASFDEMIADARAHRIEPISPWLEEQGGERFITIPEGLGFPVTREKLDGLWRG